MSIYVFSALLAIGNYLFGVYMGFRLAQEWRRIQDD